VVSLELHAKSTVRPGQSVSCEGIKVEAANALDGTEKTYGRGGSMIIAIIQFAVSTDHHREFLQTMQSLLRPIREEKGCLGSRLYFELGEEDTVCLIEEWQAMEDFDNHLRSEYFEVLLGAARLLSKSELEFKLLTQSAGIEVLEARHGRVNA